MNKSINSIKNITHTIISILKNGITIKLIISFLILITLYRIFDEKISLNSFKIIDLNSFIIAVSLQFFHLFIGTLRWKLLLLATNIKINYFSLLRIFAESAFANQVMITSLGSDIYKIWGLKQHKISFKLSVTNITIDRIFSLIGLLLVSICSFTIVFFNDDLILPPKLQKLILFIFFIFLSFCFLLGYFKDFIIKKINFFEFPMIFFQSIKNILNPIIIFKIILVAIGVIINLCISFYFLTNSLGINVSIYQSLIFFPLVLFLISLPISFAGWGVREGSLIVILSLIGVSTNNAFNSSILFGIITIIGSLPGVISLTIKLINK